MRNSVGALLLFILIVSCSQRHTYMHVYQAVSDKGWRLQDTLLFQLPSQDVSTTYDLQLEIRHNVDINYERLFLSVAYFKLDSCISFLLANDTIPIQLIDKNGFWLGKGIGRLYQIDSDLKPFHLEKESSYYVKISHLQQDSLLMGIDDIGLRLY